MFSSHFVTNNSQHGCSQALAYYGCAQLFHVEFEFPGLFHLSERDCCMFILVVLFFIPWSNHANSYQPCQSLFVSPCSHTWHFKCIRSLLHSPQYPNFVCPNCRAAVDLEDDVDEPSAEWQVLDEQEESFPLQPATNGHVETPPSPPDAADATILDNDAMDVTVNMSADSPSSRGEQPHATSQPLPIRNPASGSGRAARARGTPSPPAPGPEGPITPRNDAGPWVFDGNAGRNPADPAEMRSLDAAAMDMDPVSNEQSDDSAR